MSNKRTRKQSRPPPWKPWKRARKMSLPWLPLSSEHEVTITDTEDGPFRFNLYLKKDDEKLQEITTRLHSINLRSFQSSSYIGNWCVVPFKSSFARASIVCTETDEFTVYLQDYGNQISLPFSALYEIPDFARVLPAITRVFSLNGIEVLKSTPDLKQYFNDLVLDKKFKMIVQPSPNGRTQSCDLFTERGINVLDQLRTCFGSYPVHTLNTTSFYRVLVTDVKPDQDIPWTFTVRMENDQYNFEQLKQEMTMYCNSLEPNEHYDPSIGTAVFVITDDMVWHRATVIGKSVTGIEVRYVDYGNSCTHLPSQLRPALTSLVTRLPIQGLECQLQSAADSRQAWGIFKELAFEKSWSMRVLSMVKGTNVLMVRLYDESVNPVRDINMELCLRSVEYPQTMYQPPYQCPSVPPGFRPRVPLPQPTPTSLHGASSHHPQGAGFMYPGQPLPSPTAAQNNAGSVTRYGQSTIKLYRPLSEQLGQQPAPQLAYYPSRHLETPQMPQQVPDGLLSAHQWSPTALEPTPQMAAQQGSNQSFSLDAPLLPAHQPRTSEGPHAKQLTAEKPLVDNETTQKSLQKDRDRRRRRQAERENESKNDECWGFAKKCMSDLKSSRDDDHSSMGRDRRDGDRSNERVGRDRRDGNHTNEGVGRDRHGGNHSNEGVGRDHHDGDRSNKSVGRDRHGGNHSNEGVGRDRHGGNHSNEGVGRDRHNGDRSYERSDRNRSNGQSRGRDRHDSDRSQNRDRNGSRDYTWGQERESGEKTTRNDDSGRNNGRKQPRGDSWGRDRNRSDGHNRDRGGRDRGDIQMASNHQPEESWDRVDIPSQGSDLARRDESSAPPRVMESDGWEESPTVPKLLIPSNEHTIGHSLQAVMVFMFNPHEFYMQPVCPALDVLMEQIETLCAGQAAKFSSVDQLETGNACLAQFSEDGVWYRAEVLSVSNGKAKVKFVDYGNVMEVDQSALRQATEALTSLPGQAIYCKLRGCKPSQGETWSDGELERFQAMLEDQRVQVQLVALEGLQFSQFSVVINKGDMCVNEQFRATPESLLPCKSLPAPTILPGERVSISWFISPDNFNIQFESLNDELGLLQREIREMVCHVKLDTLEEMSLVLAPVDSQFHRAQVLGIRGTKIRVSFVDQGFVRISDISKVRPCPESLSRVQRFSIPCRLDGVEPVPGPTWPTDNDLINQVFLSSTSFVLVVGSEVDEQWNVELHNNQGQSLASLLVEKGLARSTNVVEAVEEESLEPGHRCSVLMNSCQDLGSFHVIRLADKTKLGTIQEILNCRENLNDRKPTLVIPGHLVAAKSTEDDQWNRGCIMSEATEEGVSVHYVDYGNIGVVPYVVDLPEDAVAVSPLATKCCLPVASPNSPDAVAKFMRIIRQDSVTLSAHVLCKLPDDCICVDISVSGTSILELLSSETDSLLTEGYISAFVSPEEFYVQLKKHETQIQELEERLVEGGGWEVLSKVEEGILCLAQFSADQAWYRARVTKVADSTVKVRFVDYGNVEEATQFRKLPQDLFDLPPLALQCSVEIEEALEVQSFLELARDGTVLYQILLPENQVETPLPVSLLKNGEDVVDLVKPVQATVKMSHLNSLDDFYVQFVSNDALISAMSEKLKRNPTLTSVQEGDLVGAKFEDGTWYRAKVMSESKVKFIDFGTEFVTNEFKRMDGDLSSTPPLAYHCKFTKSKRLNESDKTRVEQSLIDYVPFKASIYKFLTKQQCLAIPDEWIADPSLYKDDECASSQASIHTRSKASSDESDSSTYYSTESSTDSGDESTDVGNEHVVNDESSECDENNKDLQTVLEEQLITNDKSSTETINATEEMDLVSNPEKMESTSYNEDMDLACDDVFESTTTQTLSLVDRLRINSVVLTAPPVTPETREKESELSSSLDEEALLKALDSIDWGDNNQDSEELETAEIVDTMVEKSIEERKEETSDIDLTLDKVVNLDETFTINVEKLEDCDEVALSSPRSSEFGQAMIETIKHDLEELDELMDSMERGEPELPTEQTDSDIPVENAESQLPTEQAESDILVENAKPELPTESELPTEQTDSDILVENAESELPTEQTDSDIPVENAEQELPTESELPTEETVSELPTNRTELDLLQSKIPKTSELQIVTEFGESHVAFVPPEQISPIEGSESHSLDSNAFNDKNDSDVLEECNKENDPDIEEDRDAIVLEYNASCAGSEMLDVPSIEAASTSAELGNQVLDIASETQGSSTDQSNKVLEITSETQGSSTDQSNRVLEITSETQGSSTDQSNKVLETSGCIKKVTELKEESVMNKKLAEALSLGGYGYMNDQQKVIPFTDEIVYVERPWINPVEMQAMSKEAEERRDRMLQEEAEKLFTKFMEAATADPRWFDAVKPQWTGILAKTQHVDPEEWHSIRMEVEALLDTAVEQSVKSHRDAMEMATLVPLPADEEEDYDQVDSVPVYPSLVTEKSLELTETESMQPLESVELPEKESMQPFKSVDLTEKESMQPLDSPEKVSMHLTEKETTELLESPKKESMQPLKSPKKEFTGPLVSSKEVSVQPWESPKTVSMHLTKKEPTELLESPKQETMQPWESPKKESMQPWESPKKESMQPWESPKKESMHPLVLPKKESPNKMLEMLMKGPIEQHEKPVHLSPGSEKFMQLSEMSENKFMEPMDLPDSPTSLQKTFMKRIELAKKDFKRMQKYLRERPEPVEMPGNFSPSLERSMELFEMPANLSLPAEFSVTDEIRGSSITTPEPSGVARSCETTPKQARSKVRDLVKAWEEQSPTKKDNQPQASPKH